MAQDLREAIELQRKAWLAPSRSAGLADSLSLLEATLLDDLDQ